MKVLRYSAVAAVAIFAAACGDKVTVAGPTAVTLTSTTTTTTTTTPVAPGKINSIAVAPAAVTLTVGQAVTLVAAVNADPGVATTVTWSTSDATKVTVVAGLVTALAATPGVAICATSTVNVGVKGCASAVVVAASATVPATVSIAGVYGATTTTPITPTSVTGSVSAMVNVDPGTETISKVYLKIGSVVADSQVFSAAQSAALRNAVEPANEAGAQAAGENMADATSSILLTFNSAKYDTETGAVSFANGASALSVVLYVGTTARSTATYSTNLTLNNTDIINGTWTFPSTKTTAQDAAGYTWTSFGGSSATLNIVPVLYSGKVASSYTVKYSNYRASRQSQWCDVTLGSTQSSGCRTKPTVWDTATVKTSTTAAVTFALTDREMLRGTLDSNVTTPPKPTISVLFSDGTSISDQAMTGTSLGIRVDNQGPVNVNLVNPKVRIVATYGAQAAFASGAIAVQSANVSLIQKLTTTLADSIGMISAFTTVANDCTNAGEADCGVSYGASLTNLNGITFAAFKSATSGIASTTKTMSVPSVSFDGTLTGMTDGAWYGVRVVPSDRLGNENTNFKDSYYYATTGVIAPYSSALTLAGATTFSADVAQGTIRLGVSLTDPVLAWGTSFSSADTVVTTSIASGSDYRYSETVVAGMAGTVSIRASATQSSGSAVGTAACLNSLGSGATCASYVTAAEYGGVSNLFSTASLRLFSSTYTPAGTLGAVVTLKAYSRDLAGRPSNILTRYIIVDAAVPTVTAVNVPGTYLNTAWTPTAFANDEVDLKSYSLTLSDVSYGSAYRRAAFNSAGARSALVLVADPTAVATSIGAQSAARFYNVALSTTNALASIKYIVPMAEDGTNYVFADLTATSVTAANDMALKVGSLRPKFGFNAYDQYGNEGVGTTALGTLYDSLAAAPFVSSTALIGNGLTTIADATTADVGSGATANIRLALSDALAAANSGYAVTKTIKANVTFYKYSSKLVLPVVATATKTASTYCESNVNASTQGYGVADNTTSNLVGSAVWTSYTPAANAAPAVYVFAPIVGGSYGYVGTATGSLLSTSNVGVDNNCGQTLTHQYSYPWVGSKRAPGGAEWMNGNMQFVIVGAGGQAAVARGPFVSIAK